MKEIQMTFSKPVLDLIRQRTSCRTYEKRTIERDKTHRIETALKTIPAGPFGSESRFVLAASAEGDEHALQGLGTYGVIRNPAGFIIGAVRPKERALVDFGFQMEAIVLFLADLGLGTCWLGGSFRKSRFADRIGCAADETVPAVLSVGYPREKRSTLERLMRIGAGSDKRKSWSELFFSKGFSTPLSESETGPFARCLEMVRIGPSASNKQPWRIVMESSDPSFHFYIERSSGYAKTSKWGGMADLQQVDMGIGVCHFELSAKEIGLSGKWRANNPDFPDLPPNTEYVVTWVSQKK